MDDLFDKLKNIIVDTLEVSDSEDITLESRFREDLKADSLDIYELVHAIQTELEIKLPEDKVSQFETVGDAYNFIKTEVGNA